MLILVNGCPRNMSKFFRMLSDVRIQQLRKIIRILENLTIQKIERVTSFIRKPLRGFMNGVRVKREPCRKSSINCTLTYFGGVGCTDGSECLY